MKVLENLKAKIASKRNVCRGVVLNHSRSRFQPAPVFEDRAVQSDTCCAVAVAFPTALDCLGDVSLSIPIVKNNIKVYGEVAALFVGMVDFDWKERGT